MGLLTTALKTFRNLFIDNDTYSRHEHRDRGPSYSVGSYNRSPRIGTSSEDDILAAIYTRIAVDAASIDIRHVELDHLGRYLGDKPGHLTNIFLRAANIDQQPRAFRQDVYMNLLTAGSVAVVPVDFIEDDMSGALLDVISVRVAAIEEFYPNHLKVNIWNTARSMRESVVVRKDRCAVIQNPFYMVMNDRNSSLSRLVSKLRLLDRIDDASTSGRLDLIIQLPYVVKSEARREQANKRREEIERQLREGDYGIAYVESTESITQLNRPVENNLLKQIEYLVGLVYGELGLTPEILNGNATEQAMLNYYSRTIDPLVESVVEAMRVAFLPPLEYTSSIIYHRDPFKLVTVSSMADIANSFARNEIFTANEIRAFLGVGPSSESKADELVNSNMPQPEEPVTERDQNGS